jgi:hypothetical protein
MSAIVMVRPRVTPQGISPSQLAGRSGSAMTARHLAIDVPLLSAPIVDAG